MGLKGVQFAKDGDKRVSAELKKPYSLQDWKDCSLCFYECPNPQSCGAAAAKIVVSKYAPEPITVWCQNCTKSLELSKTATANKRTDYIPCDHFLDTLY